jgi:uncharacterized protein YcsI (UPF0317 family)
MTILPTPSGIELSDPAAVRNACRTRVHERHTAGLAPGYAQANLVVVPMDLAWEFLVFCHRNPKPCPLLDVTDVGNPEPVQTAPGADLRTDLPKYRVFRNGELVDEPAEINEYWDETMVGFLLGCSFTFEQAMQHAGIPVRHLDAGTVVPMYRTNIACTPSGRFFGNMVVSMRMIPANKLVDAVQITGRYPAVHGAPVHIGDPEIIGISDLESPAWGDPPFAEEGDVPVFWACGVTPQSIAMEIKPDLMITHAPGCMFVTDVPIHQLSAR